MADYTRDVKLILSENGWCFARRGKGDHDIWENPTTGKHVTVDQKIKSRFTANAIMKQSNINHKF